MGLTIDKFTTITTLGICLKAGFFSKNKLLLIIMLVGPLKKGKTFLGIILSERLREQEEILQSKDVGKYVHNCLSYNAP